MKHFSRREDRRLAVFFTVITAVGALGCAFLSVWAVLAVTAVSASLLLVFLMYLKRRNEALATLSGSLDRILSGEAVQSIAEYEEGELAILKNEVYKLTVRLREQADALEADKLYLADSIADISHQIRTPLTSVNILVSFLNEQELPTERRLEYVRELKMLLSRMDWLITALLKISKLDAGTVIFRSARVDVEQLIRQSAGPLEIPMELNAQTLEVSCESGISFLGDAEWSAEALGNIIKNCTEHTPPGGTVRVTASDNPVCTEIVITDTGTGFSPEDLPHIFERFYKGKGSGNQSVGIGLALSRMILMKQNGTVKAENAREGGARFIIKIYHAEV